MSGVTGRAPTRTGRLARALGRAVRRIDPFLACLVGTVALASVLPARGVVATGLDTVVWWAVAFLFFLYGTRLPTRDAVQALRSWKLHASVLSATYLLFPVLGILAFVVTRPLVPDALSHGLLFLTLLPSTVQSSIAFTSIARGNVAAAVVSASMSNLLGIVVTPLLVALLLGGVLQVDGSSLGRIGLQLLVPFLLGQVCRPLVADFVLARPRLTRTADRGAVLLVVYAAFSEAVAGGVWSVVGVTDLLTVAVTAALVLAAVLAITAWGGRRLGLSDADRVVLLMCGSKKSLASGVPIATVLLPAASLGVMLLPLMLFHQIQLLVCATIARRLGARAAATAAAGELQRAG